MRLSKIKLLIGVCFLSISMLLVVWHNLPSSAVVLSPPVHDDTLLHSMYHRKIEAVIDQHNNIKQYEIDKPPVERPKSKSDNTDPPTILCDINNGDSSVMCLRHGSEVYVPFFGFLSKYFDVSDLIFFRI